MKLQHLQKVKILGEGTYGKCYLVNDTQENDLCVLKQIQIGEMTPEQIQETKKQVTILEALDHPNIVRCIEAFVGDGTLNIVMEYADGGDLSRKIKEAKGCQFSQNQVLNWFTQLCLAIKHVHDRKIIHRDLKSQNVFLTNDNVVKLGDFGIAKPLQMTLEKIKTVVGTPYYMSPEICENKEYSLKTDIWSLGVILFEMCALKPPFDANSLPALALKISKGEYSSLPCNFGKDIRKIIADLLQVEPSKRPSINELLKYPVIKNRIDRFLPFGIRDRQFSHTTLHSQNIFKRDDIKKEVSKLTKNNDSLQLNSIISPKGASGYSLKNLFPVQTPQHKNLNGLLKVAKQYNSNGKDHKIGGMSKNDKKQIAQSKKQLRKREISQPCIGPKNPEKKLKSNASMNNLSKKSNNSNTNSHQCFKKQKSQNSNSGSNPKITNVGSSQELNLESQILEIRELRGQVVEIHEQLSARRVRSRKETQISKRCSIDEDHMLIQEESSETSESDSEKDDRENQEQEVLSGASSNEGTEEPEKAEKSAPRIPSLQDCQVSSTVEKMLIGLIGERKLSRQYSKIEQNHGFVLEDQSEQTQKHMGLVSLLYGLNSLLT